MEARAQAKFVRMSPRKIRLAADLVRGLEVGAALNQLKFSGKAAVRPVGKLLYSAIANAENNFSLKKENLYIKEIKVDEGPALKRWTPKAHGSATPIKKKTSHLLIVLGEIKDSGEKKIKTKKLDKPVKASVHPQEDEGVRLPAGKKAPAASQEVKGKKIVDPRMEGRHSHAKIEGGSFKGKASKIFRRKSG